MKKFLVSLAGLLLMAGMSVARAQDSAPPPDDQQAPSPEVNIYDNTGAQQQQVNNAEVQQQAAEQPGVARISYVHGDVSTQRGDNGQWVAVTLNTPISVDDRVSTGERSSAELQLDYADVLRLSERATARVAALTRNQIQLQVGQGLVTYNVLKGSEAGSEIDTPNAAIRPVAGEGEYRILVSNDQQTQVIVRRGAVDISTPQGSTRVDSGQMTTIAGTPDSAQYQVTNAPNRDDWDRWNNDRNRTITSAQSWQKTNRYYTGAEDLDSYGHWSNVPDYGPVWTPSVGPDWAPYRAGRWVWQPYYGWTWVSYEPWGWAPYHYGRWFVWGGNWVWWPGPVGAYPAYYPVWSPAYVSFFGFGGGGWGFGVGFGFGWGWGHVGWLPVGPCDWYHPWYGHWGGRVNVVNVTNIHNTTIIHNGFAPLTRGGAHPISNINQAFTNEHVRAGFSSMAGNQFGRGSVPLHQTSINASEWRQASLSTGKMPVSPTKASYSPTDRAANPSSYQHAPSSSQRFFTSTNAHNSMSASNSLPHSPSALNGGARTFNNSQALSTGPAVNSGRGSAPSTARSNPQSGWHRFGSGNTNSNSGRGFNAPQNPPSSRSNASMGGWHTFTPPQHSAGGPASNNNSNQPPSRNNSAPRTFNSPAPQHAPSTPQGGQGGWRTYAPPPHPSQPSSNYRGGNSTATNRPPLTMNKPIVTPRSNSGYSTPRGGSPSGGYHAAPSNGGYHGAPSSGGGHSNSSSPHNSGGSSSQGGSSSHSNGGRR